MLLVMAALPSTSAGELVGTDYEPLTQIEAMSWLNNVSVEDVIDLVIAYDFVEHAQPHVIFPQRVVVVTDDQVHIKPQGAVVIRIGHFWWGVTPPDETAIYDPVNRVPAFVWGAVGVGIGALATFLLVKVFAK